VRTVPGSARAGGSGVVSGSDGIALDGIGGPNSTDTVDLMAAATEPTTASAGFSSFPNPINEVSARLVAGGVVLLSVIALATGWTWLVVAIAYGFVARVLTGPTLSPLGQLVTRVITPRLGLAPKPVPGPPKRFAQAMGAVMTVTAAVLALLADWTEVDVLLVLIVAAAVLESVFALCIGCRIFALLMRAGIIPESVCESCNDIWGARTGRPS
jgi:hypothetical protein